MKYDNLIQIFEEPELFKRASSSEQEQRKQQYIAIETERNAKIRKQIEDINGKINVNDIVRFTYVEPDEEENDPEHDFVDYKILEIKPNYVVLTQIYPKTNFVHMNFKYEELLDSRDEFVGDRLVKIIHQKDYVNPSIKTGK